MILSILAGALSLGLPTISLGLAVAAVVAFFALPTIGRYVAYGLIVGAVGLGIYSAGYNEARSLDKTVQLQGQLNAVQAQLAEAQRQAQATKQIADAASAAEVAARAQADENLLKVEKYEAQIAKLKNPVCALSDDDVSSLRSIGAPRAHGGAPHSARRPE